jgi:C4-dicarboxylate-specific signal transduction histidine kinase
MDMSLVPLEGSTNILLLGFDISERKQNEEIIKLQQQQLFTQSQFSALGEMASGIAHEINNPLAIIATSTAVINQMISQEKLDKDFVHNIMDDINDTVKRISKIIQGLRNISRDPNKDEFELVYLPELIDDVIALCGEKFKGKGIDLQVSDLEEFKSLPLELLKIQVSQVILNLLNNAFDAVQEPNVAQKWIHLNIQYIKEEDNILITVTDSGNGIPPEIADKIFNPFFTTKDIGKGTGLGLSLSKAIIKRHHGEFNINSGLENTQFVIRIPRIQQSNMPNQKEV